MSFHRKKYSNILVAGTATILLLSGSAYASKHSEHDSGKRIQISSLEDIVAGIDDIDNRASGYTKDEQDLVFGYAQFRRGNWKEAESYLGRLDGKFPAISDHIIYYRAVLANGMGRGDTALELLGELAGHPDSVWTVETKMERAKALISLGRYDEVRKSLGEYKRLVGDDRAFDAEKLIARSFIDEGNTGEAAGMVRSMAVSSDGEARLSELSGLIRDIRKSSGEDIEEWLSEPVHQMELAGAFAQSSQWDEAVNRLEKLLRSNSVDGSMETQAKWLLAKGLKWIHRYDEAISLMEGLLKDPGARGFMDDVMSSLATTYTKRNDYDKAIALRQKMMEQGLASGALMSYKIAFLFMDEGKYADAIPLWKKAIAMGGQKREAAEWYLAWCNFLAGNDAEALILIDGMLKRTGKGSRIHDRLLYWKGRTLLKMGRKEQADNSFYQLLAAHPGGYYAELAKRRLNGDERTAGNFANINSGEKVLPWDFAAEKATQDRPVKRSCSPVHLSRAHVFDRLGLHDEAAREIRAGGFTGCGSMEEMFGLALDNFAHDVAYRTAEGGYNRSLKISSPDSSGLPEYIWRAAFPPAYAPVAGRLTQGSDVDPMFVWSIMRNESAFKPEVVSPAGAVGLMQLMPATANRMAKESGGSAMDRRDLYRPSTNIFLGITYLKKLSGLFPKNPAAWAASYNAGEEAVGRWLANGPETDIEMWIEEIPYDETNLYVKKVLTSYWKYQRLYRQSH